MSMVAMSQPISHVGFKREFGWPDARPSEYGSSLPRSEPERVALPSIRQAFPELHLRITSAESSTRTPSSNTSPIAGPGGAGAMTPPEYIHSPNRNKRRRLSIDEERELLERARRVPRLYTGPLLDAHNHQAADPRATMSPSVAPRSATDSWSSSRTSPYLAATGSLPSMRSPVAMEVAERLDSRLTLPSLPMLQFERATVAGPRLRGRSIDDYPQERPDLRTVMVHPNGTVMEAGPAVASYQQQQQQQQAAGYGYSYRQAAGRVHSLHSLERVPFSGAGGYAAGAVSAAYPEYLRIGEFGAGGDSKQRKRRGNLPKETTDKLRAWFVTHLHHPYPTEDEKQELMRQTGLQMNQISNWFINARRRQLPSMINNARAEADVLSSGRGGGPDGKVLPSTEAGADYHHHHHGHGHHQHHRHHDDSGKGMGTLSDGEVGPDSRYDEDDEDDDLAGLKRRRAAASMNRGSV